jgi:hypothetical protein
MGVRGNRGNGGVQMSPLALEIPQEAIEQIAAQVVKLLPEREPAVVEKLLTVEQLAEYLQTAPEWIRRHQAELGGYRLSDGGGRNPIRFRATEVEVWLAARRLTPPPNRDDWRSDADWSKG